MVYHAKAGWLPGGYYGVTVFLVLTGYLTTLSLQREYARTKSINYPGFLIKRIKRLLPQALCVVGVAVPLTGIMAPNLFSKVQSDVLPAILCFENISYIVREVSYFAAAGLPSPLTHLWYLGLVMQFYIVWPLLLLLLRKLSDSKRLGCTVVAVMAIISTGVAIVLYDPIGDSARVYYGADTRAAELLVGCLLALWTNGRGLMSKINTEVRELPFWAPDVASLVSICLLAFLALKVDGYSAFTYRGGLLLAAVSAAVLIGCMTDGCLLSTILGFKPLAELGKRGFALYLWHYPLLILMNPATRTTELPTWAWILEFLFIAAVSEFSYRIFEKREKPEPGENHRQRTSQARTFTLPVIALDAFAVVAVIVATVLPTDLYDNYVADQQAAAAKEAARITLVRSCQTAVESAPLKAVQTAISVTRGGTYVPGQSQESVIIIGDSVPKGCEDVLYDYLPNAYMDAAIGRQLYTGVDFYNQALAEGHDSNVVVWAIGDNGVATEKQVTELVEAVSSDKRVIFMTVRVPEALQDINNELFWEMAEKYDNVTVCDWYSASAGHSEYFWDDGTHLRPEGAAAYMKLLVQTINGF